MRSPDGKKLAVLLREHTRTRRSFLIVSNGEEVTEPHIVSVRFTLKDLDRLARTSTDKCRRLTRVSA